MNREAWREKGGRVDKERRRQSLGQERPPRPLRRSNFTRDPREKPEEKESNGNTTKK